MPAGVISAAAIGRAWQEPAPDLTLRIAEIAWEIAPRRTIRTLAYNGSVPGPLLRVRAGLVGTWDETQYNSLSRAWGLWGIVATAAPLIALFLMVMKPT